MGALAPEPVWYDPSEQLVQTGAPDPVKYVPGGHAWHTLDELAPSAVENMPEPHREHVTVVAVAYDPPEHVTHAENEPNEYVPDPQATHASDELAPAALEAVPATQAMQIVLPGAVE